MSQRVAGADATRQSLIDAGLRLFGERGFDAVSTRELADHAKANIGSISYHFGGKAGLRQACVDHVIETIRSVAAPVFAERVPDFPPAIAAFMLEQLVESFATFMAGSQRAEVIVTFMLHEVMKPGDALDQVYAAVLGPAHMRICHVFAAATGLDPESDSVKIAVFSMMGQVAYFRIGRPVVMKRMDWPAIGPDETKTIVDVLKTNLRGLIAAHKKV